MQQYIGTKELKAKSMTLGEYNIHRGWTIPENEDPNKEGYLVEYEDGYLSWSPKEAFEKAYRASGQMNFGHALLMLCQGKKVSRAGWNGKGMWLILVPGTIIKTYVGTPYHKAGLDDVTINAHIDMFTATGEMQPGWLASQTDMLAGDWGIIE